MTLFICITFFAQDRARALRLARFITDIEKSYRDDVVVILANRSDCEPADVQTLHWLKDRFHAITWTTFTKGYGWPDGCNAVACDIFEDMGRGIIYPTKPGDGLLLIEPDCVPIHPLWIDVLKSQWGEAQKAGKHLMGAWRQSGPACGHVNGNAVFAPDLIKLTGIRDALRTIRGTAWDAAFAPYFEKHWFLTGAISNRWNENTLSDEQIEMPWMGATPPVLVHGCKSDDVWKYAQRKLFPQ